MEQSPSWEAKSHSVIQEITHILWNQKVHYCSQEPVTGPYPEPHVSSPQFPTPTLFL
jgi:hypothetical protein